MASKKRKAGPPKAAKKRPVRSEAMVTPLEARGVPGRGAPRFKEDKCNVPHICEFLQQLSDWLNDEFIPDYTALRKAVCNVEDEAFGGAGNPNKPPRFCSGGGTNEPADPPPPPVW